MEQLALLANAPPPKAKRKKKKVLAKRPRGRSSLGMIVPLPTDERGEEYRIGSLRILLRSDSKYVVWDEDSDLGQGALVVESKLHLAVAALVELSNG